MSVIKNVAVAGGSGSLGEPVLKAIVDSGKFTVTVLSREGSKATFPSSVKVINVDYTSVSSLTAALKGQDAVVSTVGTAGLLGQSLLIDAAIAAGVKRFIPSEYGSDTSNPKAAALPVFGYKIATRKHLERKVAAGADITYTYIINGPFIDWGLQVGFLLDLSTNKPTIYNSGDQKWSTTTLSSIGLATVGVLSNHEETKNKEVYIQDAQVSQNQFLAILKKLKPELLLEPVHVQTAEIEKASNEKLAKWDYSEEVLVPYFFVGIFGEVYGSLFAKDDNKLLGVPGKSEKEVEDIVAAVLASKK